MALRVYTRQSAQADGGALYTVLTRRLRDAGAAGITTVRGEWGFSSDERPFGDRFGTIGSHAPAYTVLVDRPRRIGFTHTHCRVGRSACAGGSGAHGV